MGVGRVTELGGDVLIVIEVQGRGVHGRNDLNLFPDDVVNGELLLQGPIALQYLLLQGKAIKLWWRQSSHPTGATCSAREIRDPAPEAPRHSQHSCSEAELQLCSGGLAQLHHGR